MYKRQLLDTVDQFQADLLVLAGFLVVIPEMMIEAYRNRIINILSLIHISKSKTFEEVIPKLFDSYDFSLNQLYDGLEYLSLIHI